MDAQFSMPSGAHPTKDCSPVLITCAVCAQILVFCTHVLVLEKKNAGAGGAGAPLPCSTVLPAGLLHAPRADDGRVRWGTATRCIRTAHMILCYDALCELCVSELLSAATICFSLAAALRLYHAPPRKRPQARPVVCVQTRNRLLRGPAVQKPCRTSGVLRN